MFDTLLRPKNQITLPEDLVQAAELVPGRDRIHWSYAGGEIRGRKASPLAYRKGRIQKDERTGLIYFDGGIGAEEIEQACMNPNPVVE